MPAIRCAQCKAFYSSDRELRDHMQTVHRVFPFKDSAPPFSVQQVEAKHTELVATRSELAKT
jgi:hypothetical protein